jgi:hypothetical protein
MDIKYEKLRKPLDEQAHSIIRGSGDIEEEKVAQYNARSEEVQ